MEKAGEGGWCQTSHSCKFLQTDFVFIVLVYIPLHFHHPARFAVYIDLGKGRGGQLAGIIVFRQFIENVEETLSGIETVTVV